MSKKDYAPGTEGIVFPVEMALVLLHAVDNQYFHYHHSAFESQSMISKIYAISEEAGHVISNYEEFTTILYSARCLLYEALESAREPTETKEVAI